MFESRRMEIMKLTSTLLSVGCHSKWSPTFASLLSSIRLRLSIKKCGLVVDNEKRSLEVCVRLRELGQGFPVED